MSGSNPYFWTRRGWDGSEVMSRQSEAYCVSLPTSNHATLLSGSTIKTFIVTLQGVDSLYFLLRSTVTSDHLNFTNTTSLGSLFYPLAILGLVRLVACLWLTEDFVFVDCEETETTVARLNGQEQVRLVSVRQLPTTRLANDSNGLSEKESLSPNSPRSWFFHMLCTIFILGLIVICLIFLGVNWGRSALYTATEFGLVVWYTFFLIISVITYGYYFIKGGNTTTVLPCVASLWYQIYTGAPLTMMLALIIISSLETRKSSCGFYYTTWANEMNGACFTTLVSSTYGNITTEA